MTYIALQPVTPTDRLGTLLCQERDCVERPGWSMQRNRWRGEHYRRVVLVSEGSRLERVDQEF